MTTPRKNTSLKFSIPKDFFDIVNKRVENEPEIENEAQLKIAQGKQRMAQEKEIHAKEVERLTNELEEVKTDRGLKKKVALTVFSLLFLETYFLFMVLLFQGFKSYGFTIDTTTLNIFVPSTILQISSMAIIITRYLFSHKNNTFK